MLLLAHMQQSVVLLCMFWGTRFPSSLLSFGLPATSRRPRTTVTFYQNQNPLTEVTFVNLQVRALMRDVKDPVRLAGRREEEARRVMKHARAYLLEIQIPECHLKEDYRLSKTDLVKYQTLWAETVQELNRLETMFRVKGQVNNDTCN